MDGLLRRAEGCRRGQRLCGAGVARVTLASMRTPGVATATDNAYLVKSMLRSYVIRRLGEPDDAAALILFLASDAAGWITGQTYPVNGGYSFAV